jgi:hypothetical protein
MYIAEMYSYGQDPNCVGVDGIVDCMGVFALYNDNLFAIHIPSMGSLVTGWQTFENYFKLKNPGYTGGAKLYVVVNGTGRPKAEEEVLQYAPSLNAKTTFYRLTANPKEAAAVVCRRDLKGGVELLYKKHADAGWEQNKGNPRDEFYNTDVGDHRYAVADLTGWQPLASSAIAKKKKLIGSTFDCSVM